ncbi:HEAT repeat domain-containing protein [Umezawaea sp.]|uniref:HEAT repeat domain-containing protein n=1 Tax=Umezawaea sp. TaxID=1955258 RepID=UPI002ED00758
MATTFEQVRAALIAEEPDYRRAAELGVEALPHLKSMVEGGEPMLAAKAAYLAGLIDDERSVDVLLAAAAHPDPTVRVAAASSTRNLPPSAAEVVRETLDADDDPGVRAMSATAAGLDAAEIWRSAEPEAVPPEPAPEPPPTDGRMPGERDSADVPEGLMPGESEAVRHEVRAEGLMPGERPAD